MATTTFNIHEAKTNLSKLILKAENGEDILIARAGKPAVRLVPVETNAPKKRWLGFLKGSGFLVPDDFNEMGRAEIEEMFYGDPDRELREALEKRETKKKKHKR